MTKEEKIDLIKKLLKEYNYDKNKLEDTLQFLLIMCNDIVAILNN